MGFLEELDEFLNEVIDGISDFFTEIIRVVRLIWSFLVDTIRRVFGRNKNVAMIDVNKNPTLKAAVKGILSDPDVPVYMLTDSDQAVLIEAKDIDEETRSKVDRRGMLKIGT